MSQDTQSEQANEHFSKGNSNKCSPGGKYLHDEEGYIWTKLSFPEPEDRYDFMFFFEIDAENELPVDKWDQIGKYIRNDELLRNILLKHHIFPTPYYNVRVIFDVSPFSAAINIKPQKRAILVADFMFQNIDDLCIMNCFRRASENSVKCEAHKNHPINAKMLRERKEERNGYTLTNYIRTQLIKERHLDIFRLKSPKLRKLQEELKKVQIAYDYMDDKGMTREFINLVIKFRAEKIKQ